VAAHEAAHAVAAAALGHRDDVHRVSLVARGGGIASTVATDGGDASVWPRGLLEQQLVVALAGAMGEELLTGEPSTAAEDDLGRATSLATDMVARFGMSASVGRRRLAGDHVDVHLGGEVETLALSSELRVRLDDEVDRLLADAGDRARRLLEEHREALDRLVGLLLEHETLEGVRLHRELPGAEPVAATTG
jgi:cell division protease FtsH